MHLMPDHELMVKKCGCKSEQLTLIGASIETVRKKKLFIAICMFLLN